MRFDQSRTKTSTSNKWKAKTLPQNTLKTTVAGTGGFWLSMWEMLPDMVSLAIGILTLVYLILKIKKEVK